ncbi:hypothetical protein [Cognatilysobacter segetis]|uniref:hypothetical protein n=1 Tax=Cognatilysobacter segetis TaxID=2492394 RepID=UPI00105E6E03|nr:hypothetical protein [Lysobacter segetis]
MHRILFTAALLALAPACVHAQAVTAKADPAAAPASPRKSHSPFGDVIRELTRAAQAQAAASKATTNAAPASHDAAKPAAPPRTIAVPATAPVLADSRLP